MLMELFRKNAIVILIIFHLVGLVGISLIDVKLFAALTPLNLLLSLFLVWINHRSKTNQTGLLLLFVSCFVLGYLVEVLGTKTGFPFGNYHYGPALGPQLVGVPLIIGVNWFLMVMGSGFVMKKLTGSFWLRIVGGAALMTGVDLAIEPLAPILDFWYWQDGFAPIMNYLGWFGVSVIMLWLFEKWVGEDENRVAAPSFYIMLSFFISLNLLL